MRTSSQALRLGLVLSVALATAALARAANRAPGSQPLEASIRLYVYSNDSQGHIVDRSGVTVYRVHDGTTVAVGVTDPHGEITLSKSTLYSKGSNALLFRDPKDNVVCSALRLDDDFLQGFDEFNVRLVQAEILDRMRVDPKKKGKQAG